MFRRLACLLVLACFVPLVFGQPLDHSVAFQRTNDPNVLDRGPLVYDVNGDGVPEIITVTTRPEPAPTNSSRTRIAIYEPSDLSNPVVLDMPQSWREAGYVFSNTPSIADMDGDGLPEIVELARHDSTYHWYRPDSARFPHWWEGTCPATGDCNHDCYRADCMHFYSRICIWEFDGGEYVPHHYGTTIDIGASIAVVGDVNGDQKDEIVLVGPSSVGYRQHDNNVCWHLYGNGIRCINWTGSGYACPSLLGSVFSNCGSWVESATHLINPSAAALADISGDGIPDVVVVMPDDATGYAKLYCYNVVNSTYSSALISNQIPLDALTDDINTLPAPVICDLDNDGSLDAVFALGRGSGRQRVAKVNLTSGEARTVILPTDGDETYGRNLMAVSSENETSPNLGVFFAGLNSQTTKMFWLQSNLNFRTIDYWPKQIGNANSSHGYTPCIAKTDIAAGFEVVTPAGNASGTNAIRNLRLDNNNGPDYAWPIQTGYSATGQDLLSAPTIADVDGDGMADMVLSTPTSSTGSANLHWYSLGIPYSPENIQWNGFQNGPKHTGLYAQPVSGPQSSLHPNAVWEGRITVHGIYTVGINCTLTIRPGTVVEFEPDAYLSITGGTLNALGTDNDSIYFRPKGAPNNGSMLLQTTATLSHCVIHDLDNMEISQEAGTVQIEACHIYNMNRRTSQIDAAAKNKIDSIN